VRRMIRAQYRFDQPLKQTLPALRSGKKATEEKLLFAWKPKNVT
jgi:hypothetical protein